MGTHPSPAAFSAPPTCLFAGEAMACAPVSDRADRTLTSACESCQRAAAQLAPSLPRAMSWGVALAHVANRATALRLTIRLHDSDRPGPRPGQPAAGARNRPACVRPAAPAPNDSFRAPAGAGRAIRLARGCRVITVSSGGLRGRSQLEVRSGLRNRRESGTFRAIVDEAGGIAQSESQDQMSRFRPRKQASAAAPASPYDERAQRRGGGFRWRRLRRSAHRGPHTDDAATATVASGGERRVTQGPITLAVDATMAAPGEGPPPVSNGSSTSIRQVCWAPQDRQRDQILVHSACSWDTRGLFVGT